MQNPAQTYFQTQINTTSQGDIVVMLFDGALRFLAQAREKMLEKDVAAKGNFITKAIDIVNELDSSLNMEKGGALSTNLHNLYFLCTTRLVQANIKLDVKLLDGVVDTLAGLRDAFAQIVNDPLAQATAAKLSAQQSVASSTHTARVMTTAPSAGVGKLTANSAYAQIAKQAGQNATQQAVLNQSMFIQQTVAPESLSALKARAALQNRENEQNTPIELTENNISQEVPSNLQPQQDLQALPFTNPLLVPRPEANAIPRLLTSVSA